jgi:putative toxin-antitoxin system antitoxin component (TIGR02293 family)
MKTRASTLKVIGVERIAKSRSAAKPGRSNAASTLRGLVDLRPRTVPFRAIQTLAAKLGVKPADLLVIVDISARTAARRKKEGYLTVAEADRLLRIAGVVEEATRVFGRADKAARWLTTEHLLLGGETPLSLLDSDAGTRLVTEELTRIDYGEFA